MSSVSHFQEGRRRRANQFMNLQTESNLILLPLLLDFYSVNSNETVLLVLSFHICYFLQSSFHVSTFPKLHINCFFSYEFQ